MITIMIMNILATHIIISPWVRVGRASRSQPRATLVIFLPDISIRGYLKDISFLKISFGKCRLSKYSTVLLFKGVQLKRTSPCRSGFQGVWCRHVLDFQGVEFPGSRGNFPKIWSQGFFVCGFLDWPCSQFCILPVTVSRNVFELSFFRSVDTDKDVEKKRVTSNTVGVLVWSILHLWIFLLQKVT